MLQATRDIRKVALWLSHADIRTTEVYLRMDPHSSLACNPTSRSFPATVRQNSDR